MSEQPLTYDWVAGKPKAVPADKLPPKEYMKGNREPPLQPVALQHRW